MSDVPEFIDREPVQVRLHVAPLPWLLLLVVLLLGTTLLVSAAGVVALAWVGDEIPPALAGLAGGSLGSLGALAGQLLERMNGRRK